MLPTKQQLLDAELSKFGNWAETTDTKAMAKDLKKRGLEGAQQLIDDTPDISNPNSIRHSQSDWKVAAIQNILSNAKKANIRTPEAVRENKNWLISGLDQRYKDAINSDSFKQIHPNFWEVISHSILPEQHAKFDKNKNQTASLNSAKSVDEFFKK